MALQYAKDQHSIRESYAVRFAPPRPDQLSVISQGVLEGLPVQGVRYPSARRDLAKYIALPPGFRFDLSSFEDVWFKAEATKM